MARTHAHTSVQLFSFPLTHTHTCLSPAKADLSLPHLCSALFLLSSAWIRALVWAITSSTGGEGPSIPPSICYSIPPALFLAENEEVSQKRGGKRTSHHLCKLLRDHKENPAMISKRLSRKGGEKKKKRRQHLSTCSRRL